MVYGIEPIFITLLVALGAIAVIVGLLRFSAAGVKAAFAASARVVAYGGSVLLILFLFWAAIYYAGAALDSEPAESSRQTVRLNDSAI